MSQDQNLLCISGFCGLVTFAMFVIGVAMMMEAMVHMFGATLNKQCCFVNLLSLSCPFPEYCCCCVWSMCPHLWLFCLQLYCFAHRSTQAVPLFLVVSVHILKVSLFSCVLHLLFLRSLVQDILLVGSCLDHKHII
jgi:hypothetical protein